MRGWVLAIAVAALGTYGATRVATILTTKGDLTRRVERNLDFVDERSFDSVREDLVREAKRLGIELRPADIHITYEDTTHETYPQRVVDKIAEFKNKQIEISLQYRASILGIDWPQAVSASKIKQIQVRRAAPSREYDELLK